MAGLPAAGGTAAFGLVTRATVLPAPVVVVVVVVVVVGRSRGTTRR
jgi:hypothetical protein